MKTVLITGCSSGFGHATAEYFLARGWKVIATMRTPDEGLFAASEHLRVLALDVTDPNSIQALVEAAGPIDVLVNNAGIGLLGALEGCSIEAIRGIFENQHVRHHGNDSGSAAAVSAAQGRSCRQRHLKRNAEVTAAAQRVYRQQGGSECLYRVPGA